MRDVTWLHVNFALSEAVREVVYLALLDLVINGYFVHLAHFSLEYKMQLVQD